MAGSNEPGNGNSGASHWQILGQTEAFRCPIFSVVRRHCRHPERQQEHDFFVIECPDWVLVLALTADGRLVMVRQYRFGLDAMSFEIPGGVMDGDEDVVEAGLRELREETGFEGKRARIIGSVSPNPAIQVNRVHFVLVEDVVQTSELSWDTHEELDVALTPVDEVLAMARNGGITHALAINALFAFEPFWRERQQSDLT